MRAWHAHYVPGTVACVSTRDNEPETMNRIDRLFLDRDKALPVSKDGKKINKQRHSLCRHIYTALKRSPAIEKACDRNKGV